MTMETTFKAEPSVLLALEHVTIAIGLVYMLRKMII